MLFGLFWWNSLLLLLFSLRVLFVPRLNKPNFLLLNVYANIFYKPVRRFWLILKSNLSFFCLSGELNEHLLPETREQFYLRHSTIDDDDIAEWGSYMEPNPKPGSVQRKQLYNKAVRSIQLISKSLDHRLKFLDYTWTDFHE